MKKIKLLFTIPNFDTAGSGKVVYDLATHLDKAIFEVEIACGHSKGDFFRVVKETGLKIHIVDFAVPFRPYYTLLKRLRPLISFIRENEFEVIHSWHWSSDWTEPLASRLAGVRWLYTKKAMGWGNIHWKIRSYLANHIVCINSDMKNLFFHGWRKISQIPIGIDLQYYQSQPVTRSISGKIEFEESDFVLVSVANLVPVKGIELTIKAIERIGRKNIKYLVVGDYKNDYGMNLLKEIKDKGLDDQIFFTGKVLDVRPYLALADLFIIPTKDEGRKEGMPIAPVEAMASSRIVIGSRIPGIKDILEGFDELMFEPGDATAIKDKILQMAMMASSDRMALATKLRERVERYYSLQHFVNSHTQLYRTLIS